MKPGCFLRAGFFVSPLLLAGACHHQPTDVKGTILTGDTPICCSAVTLYMAGGEKASGETEIGSTVADENGEFTIPFDAPGGENAVYYVIADGPDTKTRLATVLGDSSFPRKITINERTTVATAVAMAQFIDETHIGGNSPGLQNAAGTFRNLVDLKTGAVGHVLGTSPNGLDTRSMRTFNSLANMLAGCLNSEGNCDDLFIPATPPDGPIPDDTLEAAINIAHYSWRHIDLLFAASEKMKTYEPALLLPPHTWAIALKYIGNGHEFDGPGAIAFDKEGNAWVGNNYVFRTDHSAVSCGSKLVSKLTPTGEDAPGAPYNGRKYGVNGVGFGTMIDITGHIWVGNFGFFGSTCPEFLLPPANSVTRLRPNGSFNTPRGGFTEGCIDGPQGMAGDLDGGIWIANACGGTITRYIGGDPHNHWVFDIATGERAAIGECPPFAGPKPFGMAVDGDGNGWATDNRGDMAFKLSPDGDLLAMTDPNDGIHAPMGIAVDSQNNAWVSNSVVVNPPCVGSAANASQDYGDLMIGGLDDPSISKLDTNGNLLATGLGGGLTIPWGIAVDGADNIWVANFAQLRVSYFDGETATPIAPDGFSNDGLMRITGVSIDASGNVWLCNNWLNEPPLTNPGGDGLVVFVGIAAPIKMPLIGPPQQP